MREDVAIPIPSYEGQDEDFITYQYLVKGRNTYSFLRRSRRYYWAPFVAYLTGRNTYSFLRRSRLSCRDHGGIGSQLVAIPIPSYEGQDVQ